MLTCVTYRDLSALPMPAFANESVKDTVFQPKLQNSKSAMCDISQKVENVGYEIVWSV